MNQSEITDIVNKCPKFLTAKEVADIFGVKPTTIYLWNKKGILPGFHKVGRNTIRFDSEAIIMYANRTTFRP